VGTETKRKRANKRKVPPRKTKLDETKPQNKKPKQRGRDWLVVYEVIKADKQMLSAP